MRILDIKGLLREGGFIPKAKKKLFGWNIVLVCFLLMAVTFPPMYTLIGQTVAPMTEEFEVSRTVSGLVIIAGFVGVTIGSPLAGRVHNRHKTKHVVAIALVGISACCVSVFFSQRIELVILLSAARGFVFSFVGIVAVSVMINSWFGSNARGKAQALTMMGSGAGGIIISPILARIIVEYGWRYSYLLFASLNLVVLPLVLLFFVSPPTDNTEGISVESRADSKATIVESLPGLSGEQALRSRMFWFSACCFVLMGGANQTWNINAAPFYEDLGVGRAYIGSIVAISSFTMMIGKLILGMVCDRLGAKCSAAICIGCAIIGYGLATLGASAQLTVLVVPCAMLLGFWLSMSTTVMPIIAAELYGSKEYGVCLGYCQMGDALGASIIPVFTTLFYDATGNYALSFGFSAISGAVMMVMLYIAYKLRKGEYARFGLTPESL